jgi:hypothetical protein
MGSGIAIKVLDGSPELIGKELYLEKQNETSVYICKKSQLKVVDLWDELQIIGKYRNGSGCKMHFQMLLFSEASDKTPLFIEAVQFHDIKPNVKTNIKTATLHERMKHFLKIDISSFKTLLPNVFSTDVQ